MRPPGGELLLAKRGDHVLGCIALKALAPRRGRDQAAVRAAPGARPGVGKALVRPP